MGDQHFPMEEGWGWSTPATTVRGGSPNESFDPQPPPDNDRRHSGGGRATSGGYPRHHRRGRGSRRSGRGEAGERAGQARRCACRSAGHRRGAQQHGRYRVGEGDGGGSGGQGNHCCLSGRRDGGVGGGEMGCSLRAVGRT